jgi:hypothetical protein
MELPRLDLDRRRAAVHRLADSIWWGSQGERLPIVTLDKGPLLSGRWLVIVALAAAIAFVHGC